MSEAQGLYVPVNMLRRCRLVPVRGLEDMQVYVRGEARRVQYSRGVSVWFNEDGPALSYPVNERITKYANEETESARNGYVALPLLGNIVIVGETTVQTAEGPDLAFTDVPSEVVEYFRGLDRNLNDPGPEIPLP